MKKRLSRRRFLGGALVASAVLTLPGGLKPARAGTLPTGGIRSGKWIFSASDLTSGSLNGLVYEEGAGSLRLKADAFVGQFTSAIHRTEFHFDAAGTRWLAGSAPGTSLAIELRTSEDGANWSNWTEVMPAAEPARAGYEEAGELTLAQGFYLQCRVTLQRDNWDQQPDIKGLTLIYLDSSQGPTIWQVENSPSGELQAMAGGQPAIVSRASWGCPEPNSSVAWPPVYFTTLKLIVHHTASSNNPPDPAASVRAIWNWHAKQLGWGDIGYNFLIDQYGNIFEGRYGGPNVAAGHALCYNNGSVGVALLGNFMTVSPTPAAIDALASLLAWKCSQHRIDPLGQGLFIDKNLYNICAHRDGAGGCNNSSGTYTSCPGDNFYSMLSIVRARTAAQVSFVPGYREVWLAQNTPSPLLPGQSVSVSVTVQNMGSLTWTKDGRYAYRLGYHWYRSDGSQYPQSAEDDKRTNLPFDVMPGQTVALNAQLTAPRETGAYRLEWDMVREGYTWFKDVNNSPLAVGVQVALPALEVRSDLRFLADNTSYRPGPQSIRVFNDGPGTLNWTATSNADWCTVDSQTTAGTATAGGVSFLTIGANRDAVLQAYGYDNPATAEVTVNATSPDGPVGNAPRVVTVTLVVYSQPLRKLNFPMIRKG